MATKIFRAKRTKQFNFSLKIKTQAEVFDMSEVIRSFCTKLNVKYTDELIPYYNKGLALFNKKGNYIVDKDRLITLNSKYKIFRKWFNSILEACDAVAKDKDLLLFTYVLAAIIEKNAKPSMIGTPDFGDIATDFAPIFSLLYFLEDMISNLESRYSLRISVKRVKYNFD